MGLRQVPNKRNPYYSNQVAGVTITAGAEATNVRRVSIQATSNTGGPRAAAVPLTVYLSDVATGIGVAASAPSGGVAAVNGSGAVLAAVVAGKVLMCVTNASGLLRLDVTEETAKTFHVVVQLPDGSLSTPFALAFAA